VCVWLFKVDVTLAEWIGAGVFVLGVVSNLVGALVRRVKIA
jgi:hypothetical protein